MSYSPAERDRILQILLKKCGLSNEEARPIVDNFLELASHTHRLWEKHTTKRGKSDSPQRKDPDPRKDEPP